MKKLPTSVLVLSILGLVFCLLNFLSYALIAAVYMGLPMRRPLPSLIGDHRNLFFLTVAYLLFSSRVLLILTLFIGSLGSLKLYPWARRLMLLTASGDLAILAIAVPVSIFDVLPSSSTTSSTTMSGGLSSCFDGCGGGLCLAFLSSIYPLCILYYYTRPKVRDAFNPNSPSHLTNFPVILNDPPNLPQA